VAVAAAVLLAGAGPAAAQPAAPADLDEVLTSLRIEKVPTDYVVLVDLSRSMAQNERYGDVKAALHDLFGRLDPADRVSLVTFAEVPTVAARSDPQTALAAVDRLTETPSGDTTDIGAAVEAGFSLLERPDANPAAALLLLTDGLPNPPVDSAYSDPGGPAWETLAQRGRELAGRVHGYALPLGTGETGAPLLRRVLPETVILQLQGDDLADYLAGLPQELRIDAARDRVEADLAASVVARWEPPPGVPDLRTGPAQVGVELRSTAAVLPLELDDLHLEAAGADVQIDGLPSRVVVPPGGVEHLTLQISAGALPDGWRIGQRTEDVRADLRLTGRVGTPWQRVVEQDLRQRLDLHPLDTSTPVVLGVTTGLSWWLVVAAVVAALLVLLLVRWGWNRSRPPLTGTLTVERPDDSTFVIDVTGDRTVRFPRLAAPGPEAAKGTYLVRGTRGGGRPVVVYKPEHGAAQRRACVAGEWIDVGGLLLRWTDGAGP
jgi:hypothetical protein